jgi:hypothetical protein
MDAEYLRRHIGGGWHRLCDGGHTLAGSWKAVSEALPDLDLLDRLGTWANEYWKDLITTRGMPIITLDHIDGVSDYFKNLDCVNVAQMMGGELYGVSIYCNWNDPAKLVASAASTDCSSAVYAHVVAPLVSLIALGRAYYLLKQSERENLQSLIAPALKGLTRSGANILLISVIPGGFLVHLSCGIVISLGHGYIFDKTSENKETILSGLKQCLERLQLPQGYDFASICNRVERIPPTFSPSRAFPVGFIEPCLPTNAPQPPSGPMWLHEIKHDGFRIIARKEGKQVKLYSRPGDDLSYRFPLIVEALTTLRSRSCIIDGEAVACGDDGVSVFDLIGHRQHDATVFMWAFDLIELDGEDLRHDPLEARRATLASLLSRATPGVWFNEHLNHEDGPLVFSSACKLGLEGIVSKRKDSRYRSGPSPHWIKSKNPNAPAVRRAAEVDWGR